ncbi:hypothetical protein BDZ45DRAFT_596807 [Acephala macrosclerotiorum]|nr:hypothetical protein BDZ45DRAFT_596807 [Acephala macrosclerotiorum]
MTLTLAVFLFSSIVFVHGVTGHREHTWSTGKDTRPWPEALLPQKTPDARLLSFGYDATVVGLRSSISSNRLGDHAKNLLATLATHRDNDKSSKRPIIFVAHSLGGLVCEDALTASKASPEIHLQRIYDYTFGILFLGTPHSGTILATVSGRLAQLINPVTRTNLRIVNVLRRDSEVLARIQNEFHTLLRSHMDEGCHPIEITCFYEELPLPGIGVVVPKHSAILPGYPAISIHKDHREMVRFTGKDDPGFISVSGELQRRVNEIKSPDREARAAARRAYGGRGALASENTMNATATNNPNLGGITIWGDIVKSNVVSSSQTIHGGLTFKDS